MDPRSALVTDAMSQNLLDAIEVIVRHGGTCCFACGPVRQEEEADVKESFRTLGIGMDYHPTQGTVLFFGVPK